MSDAIPEYIPKFNEIIKECENLCYVTRDCSLQQEAIHKLHLLLGECRGLKSKAIAEKREFEANGILGFECVARALIAELRMYALLKEGDPDEAWNCLIDAQMASMDAVRAHPAFEHCVMNIRRLEEIEVVVYPRQVFVSAGMIIRFQQCSICGGEYGYCQHVAGRPYWGELCFIIARDFEGDHVALVENPADKRCRVTAFSVEGGERSRMTWKVGPPEPLGGDQPLKSLESSDGSLNARVTLMHQDTIVRRRG